MQFSKQVVWMKYVYFQAIAHYEQSADYYKGEESNRQVLFSFL